MTPTCWLAIIIALRACRDCAGRGWIRTTWSGGRDLFVFRTVEALWINPAAQDALAQKSLPFGENRVTALDRAAVIAAE